MRSRRSRIRRRVRGFTLLEALIATAMLGAILVVLATIMAQWLPNWAHGFARVQRTELLGVGLERLVADLSAAEVIPPNRDTSAPLFEGAQTAVTLVRSAVGPNTRPGLEVVHIEETADDRGTATVRTRAPFMPLASDAGMSNQLRLADPVVLVRAPYRISFSYAGLDRVWRDDWRDAGQLPSAIRVTLRDKSTGRTLSVSTATIVHINAPAECARVKNARTCGRAAAEGSAQPGPQQ